MQSPDVNGAGWQREKDVKLGMALSEGAWAPGNVSYPGLAPVLI
jgi:hypothetical protein